LYLLIPKRIRIFNERDVDPILLQSTAWLLSALLQLAIRLTSLVVRWKDGLSTPWGGLTFETEGRHRIILLSLFGCTVNRLYVIALTSDRSLSTLAIGWTSSYILIIYIYIYVLQTFTCCSAFAYVADLSNGYNFHFQFLSSKWNENEFELSKICDICRWQFQGGPPIFPK